MIGPRPGVHAWSHLFVRVMDVNRRLWLITPNVLMKALQKGALQEGQGPSHLTTTLSQNLMTASLITEAQRTQLLYLRGCVKKDATRGRLQWYYCTSLKCYGEIFVTFASLSLRACLAALSVSPPAVSQACLASALDSWTTLSVSIGSTSFPESSAEPSHDLFCVQKQLIKDRKHHG